MIVIVSALLEPRLEVANSLQDFLLSLSTDSPPAFHVAPLRPSTCALHLAHVKSLQSLLNLPREAVPQSSLVYPAQKVSTPIVHPRLVPDASILLVAPHLIVARRQTEVTVGYNGATGAIALEERGSLSRSSRVEGNRKQETIKGAYAEF